MDRCIRKRPVRSGRCGRADQPAPESRTLRDQA
jgi:hypothetical protein